MTPNRQESSKSEEIPSSQKSSSSDSSSERSNEEQPSSPHSSSSYSEAIEQSSSQESFSSIESEEDSSEESIAESSETAISSSEEESSSEESLSSSEESSSSSPIEDYEIIETPSKRMPGEFEPVSMVKMCYPNNMPLSVYKTIAEDNNLLILVNPTSRGKSRINEAKTAFENADVNMDHATFLDMSLDSDYTYWVRDFSPFYVFDDLDLSVVDFTYNRPARTKQNAVPKKLAEYFDMGYQKMDIVHTGGNLMQDGRGTAFSDDLVIMENDDDEDKVRLQMERYTGTSRYVITIDPQGDYIAHIDCWGKILSPDKILVARYPKGHARYRYYEQVAQELANTPCVYGYNYRIYRVDEPGDGTIAPYTNSLIANNHVYMPLGENEAYNKAALEVYQEALPGYEIVGVEGFGFNNSLCFLNTDALHCRTHEVPDKDMLYIDSREVYRGEVPLAEEYLIKANVVSYAGEELDEENVKIHYSINGETYKIEAMSRYGDSDNFTFAFQGLSIGDEVRYFIEATDDESNTLSDPTCGILDPHRFVVSA